MLFKLTWHLCLLSVCWEIIILLLTARLYSTPNLPWRHISGCLKAIEGLQNTPRKLFNTWLNDSQTVPKHHPRVPKGVHNCAPEHFKFSSKALDTRLCWTLCKRRAPGNPHFQHHSELHSFWRSPLCETTFWAVTVIKSNGYTRRSGPSDSKICCAEPLPREAHNPLSGNCA